MVRSVASATATHCSADSTLLDPSIENVPSSPEAGDTSTATAGSEVLPELCGSDAVPLPPSCVVEDDELFTGVPRRRHHHHCRHRIGSRRRHRFCRVKWKEFNFMAAILNIVAAVLVCTSLAEPRWWYISGSPCLNHNQRASYLGVKQFLYKGFFVEGSFPSDEQSNKYYYGTLQTEGKVVLDVSN